MVLNDVIIFYPAGIARPCMNLPTGTEWIGCP